MSAFILCDGMQSSIRQIVFAVDWPFAKREKFKLSAFFSAYEKIHRNKRQPQSFSQANKIPFIFEIRANDFFGRLFSSCL